jgi:phosphate acetyltransferase
MAEAKPGNVALPMAPRFSEIECGDQLPTIRMSYAQSAIDFYAVASLDLNPVHTNEEWAAKAQVFGMPETVGHGMMTMSGLASAVTRHWGPVSGNGGSVRFVDAKFTKPVPVGEVVSSRGTIKKKHYHGVAKNWVAVKVEALDSVGDIIGVAEVGYNLPD